MNQQKNNFPIDNLPQYLLETIATYLNFREFIDFSLINKSYYKQLLCNQKSLVWKEFNKQQFFTHPNIKQLSDYDLEQEEQDMSQNEIDINSQKNYNFFKKCLVKKQRLREIADNNLFEKLKISREIYQETQENIRKRQKALVNSFYGKKIQEENKQKNIGLQIPLELFLFYSLYDFQRIQENDNSALLGALGFYDFFAELYFNFGTFRENEKEFHRFAMIGGSKEVLIDVDNVFGQGHECVGASMTLSPTIRIVHIFDSGIMNYLERWGRQSIRTTETGAKYLDLFDSVNRPCSDVTTQGIRIRTSVKFIPGMNQSLNQFFYSYQIRISDNGVKEGYVYKLTTRKWVISQNGQQENVEGEGVIGMFPEISKGCEDFVYESCCPTQNQIGSMKGQLTFVNTVDQNDIIVAEVGEYQLKPRKEEKLIIHNYETKQTQVIYPPQ